MPETKRLISFEIDGRRRTVHFDDYVNATVRGLREFGYKTLTKEEVIEQLELLLAEKEWTNVIGAFMERDKPKKEDCNA